MLAPAAEAKVEAPTVHLILEIGSYAGLAAIPGLAVLSALYFSQARDVRRLREWAGRAPERARPQHVKKLKEADRIAPDRERDHEARREHDERDREAGQRGVAHQSRPASTRSICASASVT